jgi:gluconate 2-dehydrogenase gamma chain
MMERRDLLKILAAAPVAAHGAEPYQPRFFTKEEHETITALCETILPADASGGGAREAGVPAYIDTVVFHADGAVKEFWRNGLAAAANGFEKLDEAGRRNLLGELLQNERNPQSAAERFAVRLKAITIEGYAASEVGMKFFGYRGNTAVSDFKGCSHPEHS